MKQTCDCCDNSLQHAMSGIIARYEAPIPPPTHAATIAALREALEAWEEQKPEPPSGPWVIRALDDASGWWIERQDGDDTEGHGLYAKLYASRRANLARPNYEEAIAIRNILNQIAAEAANHNRREAEAVRDALNTLELKEQKL